MSLSLVAAIGTRVDFDSKEQDPGDGVSGAVKRQSGPVYADLSSFPGNDSIAYQRHQLFLWMRRTKEVYLKCGFPSSSSSPLSTRTVEKEGEKAVSFQTFKKGVTPTTTSVDRRCELQNPAQADVCIVSKSLNLFAEYECLCAIVEAIQSLKLSYPFEICLNHVQNVKGLIQAAQIPQEREEEVLKIIEDIESFSVEEICERIKKNLPSDFSATAIREFVERCKYKTIPQRGTRPHLDVMQLYNWLHAKDKSLKIDFFPGMVKDLKQFSGVFFECRLKVDERYVCIANGGRENGHTKMQCVSGSFNLMKLFNACHIKDKEDSKERSNPDYFLVFENTTSLEIVMKLATDLRSKHKQVEVSLLSDASIDEQIENAKKIGHSKVVIVRGRNDFTLLDGSLPFKIDRKCQKLEDLIR